MNETLLSTKFFIPSTRPIRISRLRLLEQLNHGLHRKLTLVSAPAGFGKTTLISEWVNNLGIVNSPKSQETFQNTWLSLDDNDNDLVRFLTYFVAAFNQIDGIDFPLEKSLGLLQLSQREAIETLFTALINEVATFPDKIIFILDDYHLIETQPIHAVLNFFLENLPTQLHMVISTREDPPLFLPRLRARDQLTELRVADLRFTFNEAADFLNLVMGLKLSDSEVEALKTRTEGWIAGLQLAALSMQGREDKSGFIQDFSGDNRYIVEYLVEEVLLCQPDNIRSFLLQTSILNRLNGSLCDAVTSQKEGSALLDILVRNNMFVVPLDDKHHWFRYHHLFADVLNAYLLKEQPDQVPILHKRASKWYEQNGSLPDAVIHALAAEDLSKAAALIELSWPEMDGRFQTTTWLGWAKSLPDKLVLARPVLSVAYAWALLNEGEMEAGEARLQDAELWQETSEVQRVQVEKMVVVDQEQFQNLPASIATARCYIAQALGDVSGSIKYGRQALDLLPDDDYLRRGPAAALLGLTYWSNGDLDTAHAALTEAMIGFQRANSFSFAISITYGLADIKVTQGRLQDAIKTYERSLEITLVQGEPILRGTADLYSGIGVINIELGNLETAKELFQKAEALGEKAALQDWPYRIRTYKARLEEVQENFEDALNLLDEAENRYFRTPVPNVRSVGALKARVWLKQNNLHKALKWAREQNLSADGELSYLYEFEFITFAHILIAQYKEFKASTSLPDAIKLLDRLSKVVEEENRVGNLIEILILQSLAFDAQNNVPLALSTLKRALTLAMPERYIQIFVDAGQPLKRLLNMALDDTEIAIYVRQILAAFPTSPTDKAFTTQQHVELIEPLSEREYEVLELIAEGLTNQEIADRLYLSLHTVKIHARNIYGKLNVKNRTHAVKKGKILGILQT